MHGSSRNALMLFLISVGIASAACNAPLADVFGPAQDGEQGMTPTPTHTAEPSPTPTPTPTGSDALALLDSLPSLATTRQRLLSMQVTRAGDGSQLSGLDLLSWLLVDQEYDPKWTNAQKEQLLADLDAYDFPSRGQRILLVSVAHGLMLEVQSLVPWSLADYSASEINNLFIEDTALHITNPGLDRGTLPQDMPNLATHTHPMSDVMVEGAHVLQYHLAARLIGEAASHSEAASALIVWMQQNFFHAYEDYPWDVYLDGREPLGGGGPSAYPLNLARVYDERVVGCHEPAIMLEGMLHALNIPALRLSVHGHGVVNLPSLGRYVHGDHIANYTASPPGVLLLTPDEFRPYAQDVAWIFQIYFDKYDPPMSVPLWRDGDVLYIHNGSVVNRPEMTCRELSPEYWAWLSTQLAAYNIVYDDVNCELTSDRVPILTLEALSAPGD